MNSIKKLHDLNEQWRPLSQLHDGDRLNCSLRKGFIGKISSPDFKKGPKLIQKIIEIIRKIFQALYRLFTGQNEEKSLKVCRKNVESLKTILLEINKGSKCSHSQLGELVEAQESLQKLVTTGYETYKKTIDSGAAWLVNPKKTDKEKWKQEVDSQIEAIKNPLKNIVGYIEEFKKSITPGDRKTIKKFMSNPNKMIQSLKVAKMSLLKDVVIEAFEREFGACALPRVLKEYKLSDKTLLSGDEVYALYIGCRANIRSEDIKGTTPKEICKELREKRSFEPLEPLTKQIKKNVPYKLQLERDIEILRELKAVDLYNDGDGKFPELGISEFLTRNVIYALCTNVTDESRFPEGILIPGFDAERNPICFETKCLVAKDGVMGACFVPFKAPVDHVHVVFRGLNCFDSAIRCFNLWDRVKARFYDGVGFGTYKKYEPQIFDRLKDYLVESIALKVSGHSLGGVDAQRLTVSLATNKNPVKSLDLCVYNSPGIDKAQAVEYANEAPKNFSVHHFLVEEDLLQHPGHIRLGKWCHKGEVKVSLFKHEDEVEDNRNYAKRKYDAHCAPLLVDPIEGAPFRTTYIETLCNKDADKHLITHLGSYASNNENIIKRELKTVFAT